MFEFELDADDIPALGDQGALVLRAPTLDPSSPVPADVDPVVLSVDTGLAETLDVGDASLGLSLTATTRCELALVQATSPKARLDALADVGLNDLFADGAHPDRLLSVVRLGASATGGIEAKAQLNPVLTAGATLEAGVEGALVAARLHPLTDAASEVLPRALKAIRLPSSLTAPPAEGGLLVLQLGGSLKLGASLNLGYEVSGTSGIEIGDLAVQDTYALGLVGKLSLDAGLSGSFRIEVRAGSEPGWARVTVKKGSERAFGIAANVDVKLDNEIERLPDSPYAFLEAMLGLEPKSWLNLMEDLQRFTDVKELDGALDALAKTYLEKLTGVAFEGLDATGLGTWIEKAREIASAVDGLEQGSVELLTRFWDAAQGQLDAEVTDFLEAVADWASLDALSGSVLDGQVGQVLFALTGGDPLGWLSGEDALGQLKAQAAGVLGAARDEPAQALREAIQLAKAEFRLGPLLDGLEALDRQGLEERTNEVVVGLAERLVGEATEGLGKRRLGKLLGEVHEIVDAVDDFADTAYDTLRDVVNGSYRLSLHAGYNQATARSALLDLELDLRTSEGRELMAAAGLGRFDRVLRRLDPRVARLHSGVLTDTLREATTLRINVLGWKNGWKYESVRSVVVESEQRLEPTGAGGLLVLTNLELTAAHERKKLRERVHTNFVLGLLGRSQGALEPDERTQRYLIHAIESMSASYELVFEDQKTDQGELEQYLSFADELGLAHSDSDVLNRLVPSLPRDASGGFGAVTVSYDVRLLADGLNALFLGSVPESRLRRRLRLLVLVNYLSSGLARHAEVAWAYLSPLVRERRDQLGAPSFASRDRKLIIGLGSPLRNVVAPASVTLSPDELEMVNWLYGAEDAVMKAFRALRELLASGKEMPPRKYQKKLRAFGRALHGFDKGDRGQSSLFALFDAWIQESGHDTVRSASLTLKATVGERTVEKMLVTAGEA